MSNIIYLNYFNQSPPQADEVLERFIMKNLLLIIDDSRSMILWKEKISEVKGQLKAYGNFGDTQSISLSDEDDNTQFVLSNFDNDKTTLIISDCVSKMWYDGRMYKQIEALSKKGEVSILQVLPQRLWDQTGIGVLERIQIESVLRIGTKTDIIVRESVFADFQYIEPVEGIPVAIVELENLEFLEQFIKREREFRVRGVIIPTGYKLSVEDIESSAKSDDTLKIFNNFRRVASPQARKLAGYLSVMPLNLKSVEIIKNNIPLNFTQANLAEVLLSHLVKWEKNEMASFEFIEGIREYLMGSIKVSEIIELISLVSNFEHIENGEPILFDELVQDIDLVNKISIKEEDKPFINIMCMILNRLGNPYHILAKRLGSHFLLK